MESPENSNAVFRPSHKPWKSMKPIPTFPPHDDYADEFNPGQLRDTYSEGKVNLYKVELDSAAQSGNAAGQNLDGGVATLGAGPLLSANDPTVFQASTSNIDGYGTMAKRLSVSTKVLYFILLWCVFSFKVLVGGVGEAGLRVDDVLLAVAFAMLVFRGDIVKIPFSASVRAYLIFISISLCSTVWNAIAGRVDFVYSMLFVVRLLEYMVFYYLGYALLQSGVRVWHGLRIYFYCLCVVVPLQMLHLLPTASAFDVSRASGNTNGPYELAAVAAFFLCYFGYSQRKGFKAAGSVGLLLLTASRVSTVGAVVGYTIRFLSRSTSKAKAVAIVLLAFAAIAAGATWFSSLGSEDGSANTLGSRMAKASSLLSTDFQTLYAAAPVSATSSEYMNGMFLDAAQSAHESESDASGMIRAFRWSSLIKSTLANYETMAIGLGPSFGSAAVDGYYVRVFSETGIAGLVAFTLFLCTLIKRRAAQSDSFREFVVILIVTACFIDIFSSYKTMLLLWLWTGMNEFERRRRRYAHSLSNESGCVRQARWRPASDLEVR